MGLNHRKNTHQLNIALPLLDAQGNVEGWYRFADEYLAPEVQYTSLPPTTRVTIGGRSIEIDRAVPIKIRLLEEDEDYHFWCKKRQHSQRINCGEYHKDFGDCEVGYSFSSPQTHIWFAGYALHTDCFENLFISSHNATVRVTPEHVIPRHLNPGLSLDGKNPPTLALTDLVPSKSLFQMVVEEGADFPIYTAAIPKRIETHKGYVTNLVPTAEFINDCEREIIRRDAWDVGAAVAQISDPVSYPPTFPPVKPFEHSALFWSFIYNQLLEKRISRDDLEQAFVDIVLISRYQQYSAEKRAKDRKYQKALDRLAALFATPEAQHKAMWPVEDPSPEYCDCVACQASPRKDQSHHRRQRQHHHNHHHQSPNQHHLHHHQRHHQEHSPGQTSGSKDRKWRSNKAVEYNAAQRHEKELVEPSRSGGRMQPSGRSAGRHRSHHHGHRHKSRQRQESETTDSSVTLHYTDSPPHAVWDREAVSAAASRLTQHCSKHLLKCRQEDQSGGTSSSSGLNAQSPEPDTAAPLFFYAGGVRTVNEYDNRRPIALI